MNDLQETECPPEISPEQFERLKAEAEAKKAEVLRSKLEVPEKESKKLEDLESQLEKEKDAGKANDLREQIKKFDDKKKHLLEIRRRANDRILQATGKGAWGELSNSHRGWLEQFAHSQLQTHRQNSDPKEASLVVDKAMIGLFKKMAVPTEKTPSYLNNGYLRRAVKFRLSHVWKKNSKHEQRFDRGAATESQVLQVVDNRPATISDLDLTEVRVLIKETLKADEYQLYEWKFVKKMTLQEIGKKLGKSTTTAHNRLRRILTKLQKPLKDFSD